MFWGRGTRKKEEMAMATMRNRMATVVILVFVAGVTAAALWAPGASAADFTIKVPVQLSNMDPSVKIQLVCDAYSPTAALVQAVLVPLDATGSYSGTLTCELNAAGSGSLPQDMKTYKVVLAFTSPNANGGKPTSAVSLFGPLLKPGAPVMTEASGPIP
jgi:hypothetical protein